MATIHDIACPRCGEVHDVEKEGLDSYRCRVCAHRFSAADLL